MLLVVDDFHFFFALANAEQIHQVLHQQNGGGLSRRMSRGMSSNFKIFYSCLYMEHRVRRKQLEKDKELLELTLT